MNLLLLVTALGFTYVSAIQHRPLVIWHGLGDSHSSPGMLHFKSMIQDIHPGIFVHSVYIDEDLDKDRDAGFYGNVNDQVGLVSAQLNSIQELQGGFDAMGLSQGGQFLRAYIERYNNPPVNNLITFGSQHMGISDIPACKWYDFLCEAARQAAKAAVYGSWAQENLVQAQYYRDPAAMDTYLASNHFLTSINNEIPTSRNQSYARNLASLQNLVLVLFTEDKMVVPKESAWFGSEAVPTEDMQDEQTPLIRRQSRSAGSIIPMRRQPLYQEDWIGLRELDERKGVVFEVCKGEHMQMGDCWEDLVRRFIGSSNSTV
ncbi:alpha/beta-hydrolase [Phlegmacium glaucopus]|nr:alpha/beta-hydrolase [Phlegmacium glaucopus]